MVSLAYLGLFLISFGDLFSTLILATDGFNFRLAIHRLHTQYYLGEAVIDLVGVAIVKVIVLCVLILQAKRTYRTVEHEQEPLERPLLFRASSTEEDAGFIIVPRRGPLLLRAIENRKKKRREEEEKGKESSRVYVRHKRAMQVLAVCALCASVAKALARLFQASPFINSAPPIFFWFAVLLGPGFTIVQMYAFGRWLRYLEKRKMSAKSLEANERRKKMQATWKTMGKIAFKDWPLLTIAYTCLTLAAAGESVLPFLLGKMIGSIMEGGSLDQFHNWMLYLVATAAATGMFTGARGSLLLVCGARFARRLQLQLFRCLLKQDIAFFDSVKTGEITNRLSTDCQKVSDQIQMNVNVFVRSALQACFVLVLMVSISWQLALTAFVAVPSIVFTSRAFGRYVEKMSKATQQSLADASATAEEALSSMKTVRSFAAGPEVEARYSLELDEYYTFMKKQASVYAVFAALTITFLPQATFCIVLYYGADLVVSGSMDKGDLVSFIFYTQSLFAAFNSLGSIYPGLVQAFGAATKVLEWMNRVPVQPKLTVPEPVKMAECKGEIRLTNVFFEYPTRPGKPVLKDLTLEAKPGQVVALCGESGGGKSSCIALLENFYYPSRGTVTLDGINVNDIDPKCYHQLVALVGQEPILYGRSIRENILFGFLAPSSEHVPSEAQMIEAARRANAHDFISSFPEGYDTEVGERGTALSGGQKQRIAIARALVRRPKVLILDEATSALDAESEFIVQGAIDSMIADGSMTVFVIAHRLSTIKNADIIVVVKDGNVAEKGTHEELFAKGGTYHHLVTRQMQQRTT